MEDQKANKTDSPQMVQGDYVEGDKVGRDKIVNLRLVLFPRKHKSKWSEEQIQELKQEAKDGKATSQFELAEHYLLVAQKNKYKKSYYINEAISLYEKAADNGNKHAQYKFGHIMYHYDEQSNGKFSLPLYNSGIINDSLLCKGKNYLIKLAASGHVKSLYSIAMFKAGWEPLNLYRLDEDCWSRRERWFPDEAIAKFKNLSQPVIGQKTFKAKNDDEKIRVAAYYRLGCCYQENGKKEEGKKIIEQAAKLGNGNAQFDTTFLPVFLLGVIGIFLIIVGSVLCSISSTFALSGSEAIILGTVQNGFLILSWVLCFLCIVIYLGIFIWFVTLHLRFRIKSGVSLIFTLCVPILIITYILCMNISGINIAHIRSSYYNYDINADNTLTIYLDYTFKDKEELKIPSTIDGYKVSAIGSNAFSICSSLTSIEIPSSVTSIGDRAFSCCSNLTSIEIPSSVTSIGDRAFYDCRRLTSITIPGRVKSMGFYAFGGCSNLTIYCEAESRPSGWHRYWNPDDCPVFWGYKPE